MVLRRRNTRGAQMVASVQAQQAALQRAQRNARYVARIAQRRAAYLARRRQITAGQVMGLLHAKRVLPQAVYRRMLYLARNSQPRLRIVR